MALPVVLSLVDCADYSNTVAPYLDQLVSLPSIFSSSTTNTAALKQLYLNTNPLITAIAFGVALAPIFLLVSEVNKNYSQVDRVWSILPFVYNLHYAVYAHLVGVHTERLDALCAISLLWSIRLTYNYYRKGGYSIGSEDYRWATVKEYAGPALMFLFNILFISLAQSLLLVCITTPAYILLLTERLATFDGPIQSWNMVDTVASAIMVALVAISYMADQQQWNYHAAKSQYRETAKVPHGWERADLDRGFLTKGLFAYSRHPNFAAEQGVWVTLYLWSCLATGTWYNWSGIGATSYLILFQSSTWLTELLSAGKYPEYKQYQEQVGKFLPSPGCGPPSFHAHPPSRANGKKLPPPLQLWFFAFRLPAASRDGIDPLEGTSLWPLFLIISDKVCPSLDKLDRFHRRAGSNAMDLERIKQSLRLRSGRSKKSRKQTAEQSNSAALPPSQSVQKNTVNGVVKEPSRVITKPRPSPTKEVPIVPKQQPAPETSEAPIIKRRDQSVLRPELPHTSTDLDLKVSTPFRQSRKECPRRSPGPEPGSKSTSLPRTRTMSEADAGAIFNSESSSALDFDLHPPPAPSRPRPPSIELLSESLFSSGHLNTLLRDPQYLARFTSFLTRYRPQYHPVLLRYLETQKAIKAVEYANAVAEGISPSSDDGGALIVKSSIAATLDRAFEELSNAAFRVMVDSALPMYVTYNLVKLVTECLIDEITGSRGSTTRDLVGGLSEVFCLTDPKQEDNPIIFASEEFYRQTGYGPDDVIGRNCRFLQGSKTNRESVARLRESISRGEDICETLLNYRRDGRAFINLLMIAPLHDDKGNVKYHIGAQVDVTGIVERGKGFEGLKRYLTTREMERRERQVRGNEIKGGHQGFEKPKALAKLRDLSEMFDLEESIVVRSNGRSTSTSREDDERSVSSSRKIPRRVFSDGDASSENGDGESGEDEDKAWELGQSGRSGLSGKLPGVYDSYMLIRPAPSLRIIFVSSVLRRRLGNIVQHPFLSHVAASANTLKGLRESFSVGAPVSAKISLLIEAGDRKDGMATRGGSKLQDAGQSRTCWISATPLLGSDDKIGVWMVVIVENAKVPKKTKPEARVSSVEDQASKQPGSSEIVKVDTSTDTKSQKAPPPAAVDPSKSNPRAADAQTEPKIPDDKPDPGQNGQSSPPSAEEVNVKEEIIEEQDHQQAPHEDETLVEPADEKPIPNHTNIDQHELEDEKNGFIRTNGHLSQSPSPQRANGKMNGHWGPSTPRATDVTAALERALSETNMTKTWTPPLSPAGNDSTNQVNGLHSFSDEERTPVNTRRSAYEEDHTPSPSRPGTSGGGVDSSTGKSNSKHYMDYLRHPGSRPSSEYNRALSGSFMSAKYFTEDEPQEEEVDDFEDSECARSPYSVD
ncbi:hypothetical protein AYL99_11319 [Fonsecaea erecta]|uniref:PAS domain-containing protein n=1 Tax=Fonsecaea erecta TaxID=1367422 RepID=A0A178Z337_9EURO|nr:hypothetical protein AYL99_11319 [Fonsecaea erecta]OAP54218.1 hypothetical protein AYL99_11319 [Fonsecaea erecta]